MRIASLTLLCLSLAVVPASAQTLYSNGSINGTIDAWRINFGYIVGDTFTLSAESTVGGFAFGVWELPNNTLTSVDWSITSGFDSGTVYGSGTASGANLNDQFISSNTYGYNIDEIAVSGLNVVLGGGTYWLNLQNAVTSGGDPVYWDENSGASAAADSSLCSAHVCPGPSSVGTIPSEAFTISGTTPEPGSFVLFGSGILGLSGVLRRKLL